MNTKLTLSLNSEIIEKAKIFAKKEHLSLSKIVENYFKSLIKKEKETESIIVTDEDILKISGGIKLDESINTKDLLTDKLIKKYIHD